MRISQCISEAKIGISYDSNIDDARRAALATVSGDERLNGPDPMVAVSELAESSVNLSVFVWTHPDNYWNVLFK